MAEEINCGICVQPLDPASPAAHHCPRCKTPYHYVCWVYNDRRCAVYGCEKTDPEVADRQVLREAGGIWGDWPARIIIYFLGAALAAVFLMHACREMREDEERRGEVGTHYAAEDYGRSR